MNKLKLAQSTFKHSEHFKLIKKLIDDKRFILLNYEKDELLIKIITRKNK